MNFYQTVKAQLSPHAWVDFQANLHQLIRFTRVSQEPHRKMEFFDNIINMFGVQRQLIGDFKAFLKHDLKIKIFEKKFAKNRSNCQTPRGPRQVF